MQCVQLLLQVTGGQQDMWCLLCSTFQFRQYVSKKASDSLFLNSKFLRQWIRSSKPFPFSWASFKTAYVGPSPGIPLVVHGRLLQNRANQSTSHLSYLIVHLALYCHFTLCVYIYIYMHVKTMLDKTNESAPHKWIRSPLPPQSK